MIETPPIRAPDGKEAVGEGTSSFSTLIDLFVFPDITKTAQYFSWAVFEPRCRDALVL